MMTEQEMIKQEMIAKIREMPILERIDKAQEMIMDMAFKRRSLHMRIPTQWYDEDVFIVQTLNDAAERLASMGCSEVNNV